MAQAKINADKTFLNKTLDVKRKHTDQRKASTLIQIVY